MSTQRKSGFRHIVNDHLWYRLLSWISRKTSRKMAFIRQLLTILQIKVWFTEIYPIQIISLTFFFFFKKFNFMPWSNHYLAFWMLDNWWNGQKWLQNIQRNDYCPLYFFWRVQTLIHSCSGKCFYSLMSVACTWFLCQERVSKLAVAYKAMLLHV